MTSANLIFVDADALIALNNPKDSNHKKAQKCLDYINENGMNLATNQLVLLEVATVMTIRVKTKTRKYITQLIRDLESSDMVILPLNSDNFVEGLEIFSNQRSRKIGAFDTYHIASMNKQGLKVIFSFDKGYKQNAFKLLSEII